MRFLAALVGLPLLTLLAVAVEGRTWKSASGNYSVDAELVSVDGDKVTLRRENGTELTVPIEKLCQEDREFLEKQSDAAKTNPKKPPEDEAARRQKRERAEKLIDEAKELLRLSPEKMREDKRWKEKLAEASRLDPEAVEPDFMLGILNALVGRDPRQAAENFRNALKRSPQSASLLNNLALCEVRLGRIDSAISRFEDVSKLADPPPELTHNLGRLVKLGGRQVNITKSAADRAADLYATLVASKKLPPHNPRIGWLYMTVVDANRPPKLEKPAAPNSKSTKNENELDRSQLKTISSGGTGFVIAPQTILTNRHVVQGATKLFIKNPSGQPCLLPAKVIVISDKLDVALVRCEPLKAANVPLCGEPPRRGTEVMVLGYPHFDQIGLSLKSTRGIVTSTASGETGGMMLLDAEINSGNSGGPVVNRAGQVIGVATAVFQTSGGTDGKYGAAIPVVGAQTFLKTHLPAVSFSDRSKESLEWTDVDGRVSGSTVLILCEGVGKTPVSRRTSGPGRRMAFNSIEDPFCAGCNGTGIVKRGFNKVRCPFCRNGLDPELRR